jgi:hypothetical protein
MIKIEDSILYGSLFGSKLPDLISEIIGSRAAQFMTLCGKLFDFGYTFGKSFFISFE